MDRTDGKDKVLVYIIDHQMRLLYINTAVREWIPHVKTGDYCYHAFCMENTACVNCPIHAGVHTMVFFNRRLKCWLDVSTGMIDWADTDSCHIVMARRLNSRDHTLAEIKSYDVLIELNLSTDAMAVLYEEPGKYAVSVQGYTTPDALVKGVTEYLVHPEDQALFRELWDIRRLPSQLYDAPHRTIRGRFRWLLADGDWRWMIQTVIAMRVGGQAAQVMCFIQDAESEQSTNDLMLDGKTGLYHSDYFFQAVDLFLRQTVSPQEYCLLAIDVEHFKLFNEWYGRDAGDGLLASIGQYLRRAQEELGGVAGYMGNDDFALLVPNQPEALEKLQEQITGSVKEYGDNAGFLPAFGICKVADRMTQANTMYDYACIAQATVKGSYVRRVCWYDADMIRQMENDHLLLSEVQRALENREFTFYMQPKCNMTTGRVVGAESLVRWIHPTKGLISPIHFIPTLEKNGFIGELDWYVWEEVCRHMRRWLDEGRYVVPVSVNVSQIDIYTMDVAKCFQDLIALYRLDPKLIEIEITESAYVEEYQIISDVVKRLQDAGFTVLMDDFGSGYSSLNMLKDVNVDVLKLDMKFLDMDRNSTGKGIGILQAIVSMAQMAGLRIIAEGVDNQEQVNFLVDMGCLYGQGYFFFRPLPIEEYEKLLLKKDRLDFHGIQLRQLGRLNMKELLRENFFSESVVNNILGGVAIYEVWNGQVGIVQANEQYNRLFGLEPTQANYPPLLEFVYEADHAKLLDIFRRAEGNTSGAEGEFRCPGRDDTTIWVHLRAFFLREQNGRHLYYGAISDVTSLRLQEQRLEASQRALASVVQLSEKDESLMKLTEENQRTAAAIFAQLSPAGMIGSYFEEDFPLYFANHAMVRLLGYTDYPEFETAVSGKVIHMIHPQDRETVARNLISLGRPGEEFTTTYRVLRKDGDWFWALLKGRVVEAEDGRLAMINACTDITETITTQHRLMETNAVLLRQNQELHFLNHDMPGGYHRCADTEGFRFLYVSEQFLNLFGYTREEIVKQFDNQLLNMVHPEDRPLVLQGTQYLRQMKEDYPMEFRMQSKQGYIWVIDQSRYMKNEKWMFWQGVVTDVTEIVELRNRMRLLMQYTPENIVLIHWRGKDVSFEVIADGQARSRGYTREEYSKILQKRNHLGYLSPADEVCLKKAFITAMQQRQDYHGVVQFHLEPDIHWWSALDAFYIKDDPDCISYFCINRDVTEIKQQEQALRLAGKTHESILRQAGINGWEWDINRHTLTVSNMVRGSALAEVWPILREPHWVVQGFPEKQDWRRHLSARGVQLLQEFFQKIRSGTEETVHCELSVTDRQPGKPEKELWILVSCEIIRDEQGNPCRAVGYYSDITEEKQKALKNEEDSKVLELLRGQATYGLRLDLAESTVTFIKDGDVWQQETGYTGSSQYDDYIAFINDLLLPEYQKEFREFMDIGRLIRSFREGQRMENMDYQRLYQGKPRWMRSIIHLVRLKGRSDILAYVFVMDIDAQKRQELQLTRLAEMDALTGLYNRQAAVPKIQQYLKRSQGPAAIIMLDLDNFKAANDVFGHAYGDTMIVQTASSLRTFFRGDDILCRIGGDEFMVLCKNIAEENMIRKLADIMKAMTVSYQFNGKELKFTMSIGYVMYPEQGTEFDDLYRKADIALFDTKMNGKCGYRKYDPAMKSVRYELAKGRQKTEEQKP